MTHRESARRTTRPLRLRRLRVAGLLVAVAAIGAALGDQLSASSPATAPSFLAAPPSSTTAAPVDLPRRELGEADGAVPDGVTVFDDGIPGVATLDQGVLGTTCV